MNFIVIGITDNPNPDFPPKVLEIIRQSKTFSGGKRHHEIVAPFLPDDAEWIDITVPLAKVFEQYKTHLIPPLKGGNKSRPSLLRQESQVLQGAEQRERLGEGIIVFASGDPLFFGFANTLRREYPDAHIKVYPTFNSLQMLAHRQVMSYHDMRIVSLTGRPWPEFDKALIECVPKIGVLTDREHTPATIARRMLDYGYTNYTMHVGEHLGNPQLEKVTTLPLEEASHRDFNMPNCVIVDAIPSPEGRVGKEFVFGIPDKEFSLLDGREKMITKMPIRLLTLQALDLPKKKVLWDIGFCTGSVSIEARLQFPHLQVEAFEIRPDCEAIIHENARRFGAPGINIHMGDFLETNIADLPCPDAVFIGGHGGYLTEIIAKVLTVLTDDGIIVFNSVTSPKVSADSHRLWDEACMELGLKQEAPLRIQLNDYNPIEILKCSR